MQSAGFQPLGIIIRSSFDPIYIQTRMKYKKTSLFMRSDSYKVTFHKYLESVKMIFLFIWIWKPNIMIWDRLCGGRGGDITLSLSDFTTKFKSPHSLAAAGHANGPERTF